MKPIILMLLAGAVVTAPLVTDAAALQRGAQRTTAAHSHKASVHRPSRLRSLEPGTALAPYSAPLGSDPSHGPGTATIRQLQSQGRCVFDEGYGRYGACM